MPFRSEKQRRFLWAKHPDIAKRWAHEYPTKGKLPMYANDANDSKKDEAGQIKESAGDILARVLKSVPNCNVVNRQFWSKNQPKTAGDMLKQVEMPTETGPTYAGQQEIEEDSASAPSGSILGDEKTENDVNPVLQKLSVVLSKPLAQMLENRKALQEARQPQNIPQNPGIRRYAVPSPYNPPPMGAAPAPAQAQPAPAQAPQAQPAQAQPVGGGSNPMANPINAFGAISASGNLNGNAAFGVKNSPGSSKSAGLLDFLRTPRLEKIETAGELPQDDTRYEWPRGQVFDKPYATSAGLPKGYEYLGVDSDGNAVLRGPDGKPVSMFHETGDISRPKTAASSPAWQRAAGKNDAGGLNAKGRASYNNATGGNLKAPVTESNPKGERKSRRNSFCARMGGMKKKLTGKDTASDPDSRINKALRKWNCKSGEEKNAIAGAARAIAHSAEDQGADPATALAATALTLGAGYGLYHGGKKILSPLARRLSVSTLKPEDVGQFSLPVAGGNAYQFAERYRRPSLLGSLFIDSDADAVENALMHMTRRVPGSGRRLEQHAEQPDLGMLEPGDLDVAGKYLVSKYPHRYRNMSAKTSAYKGIGEEKKATIEYAGNDPAELKWHDDMQKAVSVWEKKWNTKWKDYPPKTKKKQPEVGQKNLKTAAYKGISEFSGMPGPDQISHAVSQLGMLKALVRPDDSVLKQRGLSRSGFQSGLKDIYRNSKGKEKYELSAMAPKPGLHAALGGLGGLGAAGLLGYAGVRDPAVLAGTAGIPAIAAYFRANSKRKNLLNTAKLVKDYGLLRPKLLQQAYPLLAAD